MKKHHYWEMLALYTGFIYVLIPFSRNIQQYLLPLFGNYFYLSLAALFVLFFSFLAIKLIYQRRYYDLVKMVFAAILCTIALYQIHMPIEQVHFLFYTIWGYLALRACLISFKSKMTAYFSALALGCSAGWIDECIQAITPNRIYDPLDIFYNCVGVVIGLLTYRSAWK